MKIRTDFVTNSSSSSFVAISIKNSEIEDFLDTHNLGDLIPELEMCWGEEIINTELIQSFSGSLRLLLENYMNEFRRNMNPDREDAIDELISFLKENKDMLDYETEGSIELRECCGEDGYGYYQNLIYDNKQGKMTKWPSADGASFDEEFNERLFNGEIEELEDFPYDTVWQTIYDDEALHTAVEATGKVVEFTVVPPPKDDIVPEGTTWIENKIFVLTGLNWENDEEVTAMIESCGGTVKSSTVLKTDYLVYNPDYNGETVKMKKAKELIGKGKNIQIITEKQFWKKIGKKAVAEPDLTVVPATEAECQKIFNGRADRQNGVYVISGIKHATDKIVIPGTIDGLPVLICQNRFSDDNKLETLIFSEGVIGIESDCFNNCKRLKNVTFASTMKKFGSGLFKNSPWIKTQGDWLIINNTLISYLGKNPEADIPYGVEQIGDYAFPIRSIRKVTIPDTVKRIGTCAFSWCDIEEIDVPESVTEFGSTPFSGSKIETKCDGWLIINGVLCGIGDNYRYSEVLRSNPTIELPEGIRAIAGKALSSNISAKNHITTFILPDGLEEIGDMVFSGFRNLADIKLPSSLKKIGDYAFQDCASLTEIKLPDGLEKIGHAAFMGCCSLEKVILPDSITELGDHLFASSWNSKPSKLTSVKFPAFLKSIPNAVLHSAKSLTHIQMPEAAREIQDDAFEGCESLTEINIPEGLTTLGRRVFYGCTALKEIALPDTVRSFSWATFKRCSSLKEIVIPDGVEELPEELFEHCTALEKVTVPATVTSIQKGAFNDCPNLTVYAPSGCYTEEYAAKANIPFVAL